MCFPEIEVPRRDADDGVAVGAREGDVRIVLVGVDVEVVWVGEAGGEFLGGGGRGVGVEACEVGDGGWRAGGG